ncbi:MAG: TetR/AcrR family transcriptional regulator [Planctomycetes bacterium]|nr:TetR/AcrR family transcriptional regulator [Planctomycetota bacterium]
MSIKKLGTEIRQDQIAKVALNILGSHGISGLSMTNVARPLGIVPSAIYRHFKNKDEMVDAAITYFQERLLGNTNAVCAETPDSLKRLKMLLMRHIKFIQENHQSFPRIVFSDDVYNRHPERKTKIYGLIRCYLKRIGEIISQGQHEGRIRPDADPETLSLMFLGMIQPAAILWHMSDGKSDVTKHTEKAWKIFNEYLKAK